MPKQPLAEVFGFPITNSSAPAKAAVQNRLCPFNNKVPNCTKDKAKDPLGVCSLFEGDEATIICPVRFRENWLLATDAASFFFPKGSKWTSLTEVKLLDKYKKSAGNIDLVLVSYDEAGKILDFGSVEIQGVYISGNLTLPFKNFTANPDANRTMDWEGQPLYPRADYLSSSRKRLAPQLIYKGGILKAWQKKQAVAVHKKFFATLPKLAEIEEAKKSEADIAWLIYELVRDETNDRFCLTLQRIAYTKFDTALEKITRTEAGPIADFIGKLQEKLDRKLDGGAPDAPSLQDVIEASNE